MLLLNNAILPNFGTLIRWRAHRHVLRQSVGWFENDFAGRIANRIMQTPPAAGEAVFQVFDAITFAVAYLVGAAVLLAERRSAAGGAAAWSGWRSTSLLVRWTMRAGRPGVQGRVGRAQRGDRRGWSTAYTNIHSVKMFAHHDREIAYAREAIEDTRRTFADEMRIFTVMDVCLDAAERRADRRRRRLGAWRCGCRARPASAWWPRRRR